MTIPHDDKTFKKLEDWTRSIFEVLLHIEVNIMGMGDK